MRARRILLTLIAVFVVIVSGTSLIRTVRSFYRLDFPVSWVEEGLVINEVPAGSTAEAAGLSKGDTVIEVDVVSVHTVGRSRIHARRRRRPRSRHSSCRRCHFGASVPIATADIQLGVSRAHRGRVSRARLCTRCGVEHPEKGGGDLSVARRCSPDSGSRSQPNCVGRTPAPDFSTRRRRGPAIPDREVLCHLPRARPVDAALGPADPDGRGGIRVDGLLPGRRGVVAGRGLVAPGSLRVIDDLRRDPTDLALAIGGA